MKKGKKQNYGVELNSNDYMKRSVVSANECTGLAPKQIMNDDEVSSYKDIYDIPMKKTKKNKGLLIKESGAE